MPDKITAILHFRPSLRKTEKNIDKIYKLSKKAFNHSATLVVGPELAISGFSFPNSSSIRPYAKNKNSPDFKKLRNLAMNKGHIIFGYPETENGLLYNSALIIHPNGSVYSHKQRISKPFGWLEASGSKDTMIKTQIGKTGILICPEIAVDAYVKQLRKLGAEIIAVPMNWYPEGDLLDEWMRIAKINSVTLILANRYGKEKNIDFNNSISAIIDSKGRVKAFTQEPKETIIKASI